MEEKLKKGLSEVFELSVDIISNQSTMEAIDNWDSLSHMNLIVKLEELFSVKFEPEEIIKMISFSDIIAILNEKGVE